MGTMPVLEATRRLSKDLRDAAVTLSDDEARFLVDGYYQMQGNRIRANNQIRSLSKNNEPHQVLQWFSGQSETLEGQVKRALTAYAESKPIGQWSLSITGIGPVISAGLIAHLRMYVPSKTNPEVKIPVRSVGHFWRFAGLDPTVTWEPKTKRPWNASLKVLCFHIGESFVRTSGLEDAVYGRLWAERKQIEMEKNDQRLFADQAKAKLAKFNIGKDTDAYKYYSKGYLPPAQIHARAKRWATKMFLSHWWWVNYEQTFNEPAPNPFVIEHVDGHTHLLPPPNYTPLAR